jgi:acyl-CoA reductase-like NAD-dependent aldehyde dehydrogenase
MGDKDLIAQQEARDAVEAASFAFQSVAKLDQAKIDEICEAMSQVALAESARLANSQTKRPVSERRRTNAKRTGSPPRMSGTISGISKP